MSKLSCFDIYKMCLNKQPWIWKESERVDFDSFVACRWLSGNASTIQIGNFINYRYKEIPDKAQFYLIQNSTNLKFIKFPKAAQSKKNLDDLIKKYNISYEKALEYSEILEKAYK